VLFKTTFNAQTHLKQIHHPQELKLPCPEAEEWACAILFLYPSNAQEHLQKVHYGQKAQWPCPEAAEKRCDKTFGSKGAAKRHSQHIHGPQGSNGFYCTVSTCVNTVSGRAIANKRSTLQHMARHKAQGHLNLTAEGFYEPKELERPHSADSTENEDLHEASDEDADKVLDANRACDDVIDYEGKNTRLLDTFDTDYSDMLNCAKADAEIPQEMPDAPLLPSSKASRDATRSYNYSLRGIK
jgi:hypothetical protein